MTVDPAAEEIAVVWFCANGKGVDWMACVQRIGDEWHARYRFQYSTDPKPFTATDRRHGVGARGPRGMLINAMDRAFAMAIEFHRMELTDRFEVNGPPEKLMEILHTKPYANIRVEPLAPGGKVSS